MISGHAISIQQIEEITARAPMSIFMLISTRRNAPAAQNELITPKFA